MISNVIGLLDDLIGEWSPIEAGQHFAGIDFRYLAGCAVVIVCMLGLFGIIRSIIRR